jgi:LCP family protein required for cell wall assembly
MSRPIPSSRRATGAQTIARHGRLKSPAASTVLKFVGAALAVLLVSTASVAAITFWRLNSQLQSQAVALPGDEDAPPGIGAYEGGFNILIVGSDTREGQGGLGGTVEDAEGELNDVNILLHVSADQTNAVAMSFPRDLVVDIPECEDADGGTKDASTEPINTALSYGGLACAVKTVSEFTGLEIQFAGKITFVGVVNMADAIGGVDVCVTGPVYDDETGLDLPAAGTYPLSGHDALAFLRSRAGVGDGSDLTRISSQQVYLSSLVRKLKSAETLSDPGKLLGLANVAANSMELSSRLASVDTMVSIALALKDIPLERVTFVQYPGTTGGSGVYEGRVQPQVEVAEQMLELIRADQPFALAKAGDDRGSTVDPNAPAPDPTATPPDSAGLPVIEGVPGQTAADRTCSIANE